MKSNIGNLKIILVLFAIYTLTIIFMSFFACNKDVNAFSLSANEIDRVQIVNDAGISSEVILPYRAYTKDKFEYVVDISKYKDIENCSLTTDLNFANLKVYADDRLIYAKQTSTSDFLGSGGHYLVFFDIPDEMYSPYLYFVYEPLLPTKDYIALSKIYLGNKMGILFAKLLGNLNLLLIILLMFVNFINIIIVIILKDVYLKSENYDIFYLCVLGTLISLYFITQIWIVKLFFMQFYTTLYFIEYTALSAIPIMFILFFKQQFDKKFDRYYDFALYFACFNMLFQSALVFSKSYEYEEMLFCTHIVIVLGLALVGVTYLLTDAREYPNKTKFKIPLLIIIPVTTTPLITYITTNNAMFDSFSIFISIVFGLLGFAELYGKFNEYYDDKMEKEIYKKIANTDALTGLKNRTAYNLFISNLRPNSDFKSAWVVSIDLNGLKSINDNYGHLRGDEFIGAFSTLLKEEEKANSNISAYRIGGDEFFVFIKEDRDFNIKNWINKLKMNFAEITVFDDGFFSSFSAGSYHIDDINDFDLKKAFYNADQMMYEDKRKYYTTRIVN